jgi:hypothetical protein
MTPNKIGLIALVLGCLACRAVDPIATNPRVVKNLKAIATLSRDLHGEGGQYRFRVGQWPFPASKPWLEPQRERSVPWLEILPAEDGMLHEQYDIEVDPNGIKGPEFRTIQAGAETEENKIPVATESWCKIRAVGLFGRDQQLWEISLKLTSLGEKITEGPVVARRITADEVPRPLPGME